MSPRWLLQKLQTQLCALKRANGANVTLTFAISTIPVVGLAGAAVDYSHANAVKASMQMAADSTALMMAKSVSSLNDSQIQTKANEIFKSMFTRTDATGLAVSAIYTNSGGYKIVIKASSNLKTNFMGLMGFNF